MQFEFATAQRIVFGCGTISQLEALSKPLGARPLVVTGRGVGRVPKAAASLSAATLNVAGEPTFELVRAGVAKAREADCDSVIAVGGGSVIDAGKAVAMLLANGGDPLDYAEVIGGGRPVTQPSVPFIAIPTTAGAGAEVTRNAVLTSAEHQVKVSLRSPFMLPSVALVDPELTLDLPPAITAATGMDALSQLIEPFFSARANPVTDSFCLTGIVRIARNLRDVFHDGRNIAARTDLALGALLGGLSLANAGLGAVHGFAAAIGGAYRAPHGAVCAALLAPVIEVNMAALATRGKGSAVLRMWEHSGPHMNRFEVLASLLTRNTRAWPADGTAWLRQLATDLNIPPLRAYGITEKDIPSLCEKAAAASSMKANPIALTKDELAAILSSAL